MIFESLLEISLEINSLLTLSLNMYFQARVYFVSVMKTSVAILFDMTVGEDFE